MTAAIRMQHDVDPAKVIYDKLGDMEDVDVFNDRIMLAIYERPTMTKGGIALPEATRAEDQFQGKAAMIVGMGPVARAKAADPELGSGLNIGDWVAIRPSDGWPVRINNQLCRMVSEKDVHLRIGTPDVAW